MFNTHTGKTQTGLNQDSNLILFQGVPVQNHSDLGLSEVTCRVCHSVFSNRGTRRRHELERHQFRFLGGNVFSPVNIPPSPAAVTPQSMALSLTPPNLRLTPPPATPTNPSVSDSISSSPSRQPPQDLNMGSQPVGQSHPQSQPQPAGNRHFCTSCLQTFQSSRYLEAHHCRLECREENITEILPLIPIILKPPLNVGDTLKVLDMLCRVDIVKMAILQNWSLKGFYPFVFYRHQTAPLYLEYTAAVKSKDLLKLYLTVEKTLTLPKYVIIEDPENNVKSLLSPTQLKPPPDFNIEETDNSFIVSLHTAPADSDDDSIVQETDNNEELLSSDDDEISFRPQLNVLTGASNQTLDDTLPDTGQAVGPSQVPTNSGPGPGQGVVPPQIPIVLPHGVDPGQDGLGMHIYHLYLLRKNIY